jgi:hypothetical protein
LNVPPKACAAAAHRQAALFAGAHDLVEQGMAAADKLHGAAEAGGAERVERLAGIEAAQVGLEKQDIGGAAVAGFYDVGRAGEPLGDDIAIGQGQPDDSADGDIAVDNDAAQWSPMLVHDTRPDFG